MKRIILAISLAALCLGASAARNVDVLPKPQKMVLSAGEYLVAGKNVVTNVVDADCAKVIADFAVALGRATGSPVKVGSVNLENNIPNAIIFRQEAGFAPDQYKIEVTGDRAMVHAGTRSGFLNAIATLKQLLPAEIYLACKQGAAYNADGKHTLPAESWTLPLVQIEDQPRFAYRGMHLDCSRHFFSIEEVERYLDIMAAYKMNRFHWHLTDDQGWRIELKSHPEIHQKGGWRNGTVIRKNWGSNDGIRYGGYYTQDQIRHIVAYADALGITVIPEVDLPGHMLGVLAAHPELGCTGGPYDVWTRWGVSDDVLCVGKEATFRLLEEILDEIADLFPSEYFHIGGDECPKVRWKACPDCQKRIAELGLKDDEHGTAEQHLQNYVTARIQAFMATKGKKIIGWDEVLEGKLAPGATIMSWRGSKGGIKAAKNGFDAIMTASSHLYFDYYQSEDRDHEPFAIGGNLPLEKVYEYDPTATLNEQQAKHILGVQANLWTEYIATPEHLEYMLLPRMFALCELQWCPMSSRDLARLKNSITTHQLTILQLLGYNYRPL